MFGPPRKHLKMNIVPEGGAQSAPVRPRGAFGGPPKRKGGDWGRKAVLALRAISELDPQYRGSFARQQNDYRLMDAQAEEEARKARFSKTLENMGMSDLAGLDPQQMSLLYGMKRQGIQDQRYEEQQQYQRERDELQDIWRTKTRKEDMSWKRERAGVSDDFTQQGLDLQGRQVATAEANAAAKRAESLGPDTKGESALRKEFFGQNKGFQEVQRAYDRIVSTDPTNAAGQMSLIFQYMKMMDPGSTVREGEFANAQNTTGIPGQVLNAYNRARAGEYLNPTQVGEFQRQAEKLYGAAVQDFERSFEQYRTTAGQYEFDPERTIPDLRNPSYMQSDSSAPQFPGAPVIGTVDDGHEYVGGDPANPSSWRPVG